jgi:hypothetical protein
VNEFSNVLDLHDKIVEADRRTAHALLVVRERRSNQRSVLGLIEAVTPLEGIAYLLNNNMTSIPKATEIWKRYLMCAFYTARSGVGPTLASYVPELARFAKANLPSIIDRDRRCNVILLPERDHG